MYLYPFSCLRYRPDLKLLGNCHSNIDVSYVTTTISGKTVENKIIVYTYYSYSSHSP